MMNVINRYRKDGTLSLGSDEIQQPRENDKDKGRKERIAEQV